LNKLLVFCLAIASVSVVTTASADQATGTIKSIDTVYMTVTLDTGKIYSYRGAVAINKVKVGDKVTVTYTPATAIAQASLGIAGVGTAFAPAN
jgi:hypothetical protein